MTDTMQLPPIVSHYLTAHRDHDADAAVAAFTDDATVVDEGTTYCGHPEIRAWIGRTAGEYTYTSELTPGDRAVTPTPQVRANRSAVPTPFDPRPTARGGRTGHGI